MFLHKIKRTMSDIEMRRVLLNLKIIGMLRQNERFSTQNNVIVVDRNDFFQGLRRWVRGENRELNLQFLRELYARAFFMLEAGATQTLVKEQSAATHLLLPTAEGSPVEGLPPEKDLSAATAWLSKHRTAAVLGAHLLSEISKSLVGVENLQITYRNDSLAVASLQVLVDSVKARVHRFVPIFSTSSRTPV